MKEQPDETHRYPVRTKDGIRYLNQEECDELLDAVFAPLPIDEKPKDETT